jgi:hypothetical protein
MLLSLLFAVVLAASPTPTDQRIAERSVLDAADAPRGWTSVQAGDSSANRCPAFSAAREKASGIARSPRFMNGDRFEAQSAVYVYRSAAAARRHYRAMSGAATMRCYADLLEDTLDGAVERAPLGVRRLGDERTGTHFTVAADTAVSVDLIFVREGRGLSLLFGIGARFEHRHALTATQARRLEAALSRRPPARRAARAAVASGG